MNAAGLRRSFYKWIAQQVVCGPATWLAILSDLKSGFSFRLSRTTTFLNW